MEWCTGSCGGCLCDSNSAEKSTLTALLMSSTLMLAQSTVDTLNEVMGALREVVPEGASGTPW